MKQSLKQREQLQGYRTQHNVIHVDPVAKPRMTRSDRWRGRECVKRYFEYRDALRPVVAILEPLETVSLRFQIPMPKSWSRKRRREMNGAPHQSRPDLDNYIKGVLDVLDEDKGVWQLQAEKVWAETGSVVIEPMSTDNPNSLK